MFSEKESTLLEDLKKAEEICIKKYNKYANEASAPELKTLFDQIGQHEQQHLQTINQIIHGSTPSMNSGQGNQQAQSIPASNAVDYSSQSAGYNNDSFLCSDGLAMEKHVSSSYNTSIFEFKDTAVRNALNHIQKEEQEHGEMIYNYMSSNGMYN